MNLMVLVAPSYRNRDFVLFCLDAANKKREITCVLSLARGGAEEFGYDWACDTATLHMAKAKMQMADGVVAFPGVDPALIKQAGALGLKVWLPKEVPVPTRKPTTAADRDWHATLHELLDRVAAG